VKAAGYWVKVPANGVVSESGPESQTNETRTLPQGSVFFHGNAGAEQTRIVIFDYHCAINHATVEKIAYYRQVTGHFVTRYLRCA
jgi:hypothetical protein